MMQKDKQLLLKDLCARLSYGVKVAFFNEDLTYHSEPKTLRSIECDNSFNYSKLEDEDGNTTIVEFVKPYLFPLSSMTEEQKKYIADRWGINEESDFEINSDWGEYVVELGDIIDYIDWLNENHFDYRGLIEKELAIDATGLNIY